MGVHMLHLAARSAVTSAKENSAHVLAFARAGHFRYFLMFSILIKMIFAFFIKLIWLGVGFLNITGAEIGY